MSGERYKPTPRGNFYSCTCRQPSGTTFRTLPNGKIEAECMSCGWKAGTWQDVHAAVNGWNRACWRKHREQEPAP